MDWGACPTPGERVPVKVKIAVKGILQINPLCGVATVHFQLSLSWKDLRLVKKADHKIPRDLWRPCIRFSSAADSYVFISAATPATSDIILETRTWSEGYCKYYLTFWGDVENPMNLTEFPFDEDSIDFRFTGGLLRDGTQSKEFTLFAAEPLVSFAFSNQLPEYDILGCSYVEYNGRDGNSSITWGITVRRKHWYYFFKVMLLMWLIVMLSLCTFLFDPSELEQRMNLTATMFLATAATLYVVGQDLPKTEKLNKMDKLLIVTLLMLFLVGGESCIVFLRSKGHNDGERAPAIDRYASIMIAFFYALTNLSLFLQPALRLWWHGDTPRFLPSERVFISYKDIPKYNPWGGGCAATITTKGRETSRNLPMQIVPQIKQKGSATPSGGSSILKRSVV
jgi:hypothetical protein